MTNEDFEYVRDLIRDESGMMLEEKKKYLVEWRLRELVGQEEEDSIGSLLQCARRRGNGFLRDRIVQCVLIGETRFFRDEHPFESLRMEILPALIRAREEQRTLTIWSAASSSGQEPYSLAMLLDEHFPELKAWRLRIIASDLSDHMLERAQRGRYTAFEVGRGVSPQLRARYFRSYGTEWQISDRLRHRVEFRRINLIGIWPSLPRMDLVLLRNVLIYFSDATRKSILAKLHELLRPGGIVLLGTSEIIAEGAGRFFQRRKGRTIYYERLRDGP